MGEKWATLHGAHRWHTQNVKITNNPVNPYDENVHTHFFMRSDLGDSFQETCKQHPSKGEIDEI